MKHIVKVMFIMFIILNSVLTKKNNLKRKYKFKSKQAQTQAKTTNDYLTTAGTYVDHISKLKDSSSSTATISALLGMASDFPIVGSYFSLGAKIFDLFTGGSEASSQDETGPKLDKILENLNEIKTMIDSLQQEMKSGFEAIIAEIKFQTKLPHFEQLYQK